MLEEIAHEVDGGVDITHRGGDELFGEDVGDLVPVESCDKCGPTRCEGVRTSVDETHGDVELWEVEFTAVIDVGEVPTSQLHPLEPKRADQIFMRSS